MSKVWLVTGSSRGLGRSIAEAVLAQGDCLLATARRTEGLQDLAERYGTRIATFSLDVAESDAAERAVQKAVATFGRLDVLVNNAGYGTIGSIEDTPVEEFRRQTDVNLFGTINTTRAAIPVMRKQGSGHIIQVSSIGGRIGAPGRAPYSAAKWGVEGFSEVLAKEVAPFGIKVTIIEPGGFRTQFASDRASVLPIRPEYAETTGAVAKFQAEYDGKQPGDPAKAAQVLLKIASLEEPPLRLLLGSDAVKVAEQADVARTASDRKWRELSVSTDY